MKIIESTEFLCKFFGLLPTLLADLGPLLIGGIAHAFCHLRIQGLMSDFSAAAQDQEYYEGVEEHSSYSGAIRGVVHQKVLDRFTDLVV